MYSDDPEDGPLLTEEQHSLVWRAANEGIPIGAIARVLQCPFERIAASLKTALSMGSIARMPKADWPPAQGWDARLPTAPSRASVEEAVDFGLRQVFKLTSLEVGMLTVLLRYQCAEKEKLHGVIENQRHSRQQRPDRQEITDQKMVDVMICKLRKKLKSVDENIIIQTSWGKGYYLEQPVKELIYARIAGVSGAGDGAGGRGANS